MSSEMLRFWKMLRPRALKFFVTAVILASISMPFVSFMSTGNTSSTSNMNMVVDSSSRRAIQREAFDKQPWERIGLPDSPLVGATNDKTLMINRIAAILEHMLEVAIDGRRDQQQMGSEAKEELHAYVTEIAFLYDENVHYHDFEHASHVIISMYKLLNVLRDGKNANSNNESGSGSGSGDREGIWKNPFTPFCLVYSCLIHDVGHTGQSNQILADKGHDIAKRFPGASAELNSIKIAIDLLFPPRFSNFRKVIMPTALDRFEFGRNVYVCTLCTDIASVDRVAMVMKRHTQALDMNHIRKKCVGDETACIENEEEGTIDYSSSLDPMFTHFHDIMEQFQLSQKDIDENSNEMKFDEDRLRIDVAREHLMHVADISHLMQGWTQFIKFNYRLFLELNACYVHGLAPDPALTWNKGQIGFVLGYVLPLAERTNNICGDCIAKLGLADNARAHLERWEKYGATITQYFIDGCKDGESSETVLARCRLLVDIE